jgi:hypothetical protein
MGREQQIERKLDHEFKSKHGECNISYKDSKIKQHRRERRRAKKDPECGSEYNKYDGYMW